MQGEDSTAKEPSEDTMHDKVETEYEKPKKEICSDIDEEIYGPSNTGQRKVQTEKVQTEQDRDG